MTVPNLLAKALYSHSLLLRCNARAAFAFVLAPMALPKLWVAAVLSAEERATFDVVLGHMAGPMLLAGAQLCARQGACDLLFRSRPHGLAGALSWCPVMRAA